MNHILNLELCRMNLEMIQQTVDTKCPQEPAQIMEHLNELASIIGLCAQTNASYQYHYQTKMNEMLPIAMKMKFPPSLMKEYAMSCIAELASEVRLVERLGASIVHKIDALRSMLSYEKQERFASNMQRS